MIWPASLSDHTLVLQAAGRIICVLLFRRIGVLGPADQAEILPDLAPTLTGKTPIEVVLIGLFAIIANCLQSEHDLAKAHVLLAEPAHDLLVIDVITSGNGAADRMDDVGVV